MGHTPDQSGNDGNPMSSCPMQRRPWNSSQPTWVNSLNNAGVHHRRETPRPRRARRVKRQPAQRSSTTSRKPPCRRTRTRRTHWRRGSSCARTTLRHCSQGSKVCRRKSSTKTWPKQLRPHRCPRGQRVAGHSMVATLSSFQRRQR